MDIIEITQKSKEIRDLYHALERKHHQTEWSVEEDALAFLTDAALVGRLVMDNQGRWPSENAEVLPDKIGECVWWLAVLAQRTGLNFSDCVETFLSTRLTDLGKDR